MEDADQILSIARVYSGFPADRAVNHRKQRGWNLDMRNTAVINRRHETRDVSNHPAAEAYHERFSVKSRLDHPVANRACFLKRLRFLARWNRDQGGAKTGGP